MRSTCEAAARSAAVGRSPRRRGWRLPAPPGPRSTSRTCRNAKPRYAGIAAPNLLSPELQDVAWAQGSNPVENPSNGVVAYGYDDGTFLPVPSGADASAGPPSVTIARDPVEAQKTEPDKNTYLVSRTGRRAPTRTTTTARTSSSRATRRARPATSPAINLDADAAAPGDAAGDEGRATATTSPTIDGSTWDPWAQTLLFTAESRTPHGGVWQATLDYPSTVDDISGSLGRGGYEGIQNDTAATSGSSRTSAARRIAGTNAKRPNSFVYRFVPKDTVRPDEGRQAPGAAGAGRRTADRDHRDDQASRRIARGPRRRCTPTARRSRRSGSRSTTRATDGTGAVRRQHAREGGRRHAVQAARERRLPAGLASSRSSTSPRPATRTRRAPRTAPRAASAASSS